MNLWTRDTTWRFGVCCWLILAVKSLEIVSLHLKQNEAKQKPTLDWSDSTCALIV